MVLDVCLKLVESHDASFAAILADKEQGICGSGVRNDEIGRLESVNRIVRWNIKPVLPIDRKVSLFVTIVNLKQEYGTVLDKRRIKRRLCLIFFVQVYCAILLVLRLILHLKVNANKPIDRAINRAYIHQDWFLISHAGDSQRSLATRELATID